MISGNHGDYVRDGKAYYRQLQDHLPSKCPEGQTHEIHYTQPFQRVSMVEELDKALGETNLPEAARKLTFQN